MLRHPLLAIAVLLFALPAAPAQDKAAQDKELKKAVKKAIKKGEPLIGHMVYFKLKDRAPAARQKLVDACNKLLANHDGTVFYSAGAIAEEFKREVNDTDWDVALHLVFVSKAAHDKYQDHPDHLKFIKENEETWEKVRVFDSALLGAKGVKIGGE